jgi:predicted transcriptional regulator
MNIFRPNKNDIRQIESLVSLGVSQSDIAAIIGITPATLDQWRMKNPKIESTLKEKARPEYTIYHPDYADKIEEAFTCAGKRYYRFIDEFRMSTGRYTYYYAALKEFDLNVSREKLKEFMEAFEIVLEGGKKKQQISLGRLWELVINLKSRVNNLAFAPQLAKDLAAIAFFDDTEDITSFDSEYGKKKIALWEEHKVNDFFFEKPIGDLLNVNSSSATALEEYLKTAEQVIQDLNSGLQKVSEES